MTLMDRRAFITMVGGSILAVPLAVEAQQAGKVYQIGILSNGNPTTSGPFVDAFRQGLRKFGWIEGQNIAIEYRYRSSRRWCLRRVGSPSSSTES
jgi:putative tryptophan/tyrosine transport system substrate-binding protein